MKVNSVKQKLVSGETVWGTFLFEFRTAGVARAAWEAGAEFVLCDMEHTGWTLETVRWMAAAAAPEQVFLVRVPATEYHFIARACDMGAQGIMVPMVGSRQQAESIVQAAKYPPAGRRGAAFGIAHDGYARGPLDEKIASANHEQLLIAQIETREGLENVEAIAAVEGIDVLWIGQTDLTCALGIPGQFDHPRFVAAVERVVAACRAAGKTAGFMPLSLPEARTFVERGFRMLAYSGDIWIYQQALRAALNELRSPD